MRGTHATAQKGGSKQGSTAELRTSTVSFTHLCRDCRVALAVGPAVALLRLHVVGRAVAQHPVLAAAHVVRGQIRPAHNLLRVRKRVQAGVRRARGTTSMQGRA